MLVEIMNPLHEDVILYNHTQVGIVSRLSDLATIFSLEEKGQANETNLEFSKELEMLLNKVKVKVDHEESNKTPDKEPSRCLLFTRSTPRTD